MQRARRLASIAVIAVLGVSALSACRSDPGVAAYLGDGKITEDQVTRIVDDARQPPQPTTASPGPEQAAPVGRAPDRSLVVSLLVLGDVCERLSAEKGYQPQGEVAPEQIAQAFGVPAQSVYARRTAELYTCLSGIPAGEPVAPSAEQLADVVARGRAAGVIPAEVTDEEASAQLDGDQLRAALGTRKALADAVAAYDITVNPRYRPLEFPVLSFNEGRAAVVVPLGEDDPGTVLDAR